MPSSKNPSHDPETVSDATTESAPPTTEETKLVLEFTVPAERFVLTETLQTMSETIVEFEQLVPTHNHPMPYLWTTNHHPHAEFEAAADADSTVKTIQRVATLDGGALYQINWSMPEDGVLQWIQTRDTTVLQSEGKKDQWLLKLRIEAREMLEDFQQYCADHEIPFNVVRLYELTDPKIGQFNITDKQREILIVALEMGYFEIPREATLEAVAESIDISTKAASERLRRGQTNLVSNTLTIGQPTGVGL